MDTFDLHGLKLEEAITLVEQVIGRIRMGGCQEEMVRIVTGHGIIKRILIEYLENHQIDFATELGNDGALILSVD